MEMGLGHIRRSLNLAKELEQLFICTVCIVEGLRMLAKQAKGEQYKYLPRQRNQK